MSSTTATFSRRFDADHRVLSDIRSAYREWLEAPDTDVGRSPTTRLDCDVVATELAANVIDHTRSPWVWLEIVWAPSTVMVTVSHAGSAAGIPDVSRWGQLEEGDRGRGLRMVRALCHDIEVAEADAETSIRCHLIT